MQSLSWQESLSLLLAATRRQLRQVYLARLAAFDITPPQMTVLFCLSEAPALTLHELARRARIGEPTASRLVQRLSARGLVRSLGDPEDRRRTRLALTPAGRRLAKRLAAIASTVEAALTHGFTRAEIAALYRGLHRVGDNLKRASGATKAVA